MTIEQTDQGILIKTTLPVNMKAVQKIADYFDVLEIVSRAQGTEEQAAELARESNKDWLKENAHRFLK
ncbi:MAG: hypothetical protein V4577_19860 [Bacteroidota bacterium]